MESDSVNWTARARVLARFGTRFVQSGENSITSLIILKASADKGPDQDFCHNHQLVLIVLYRSKGMTETLG